MAIKAVIFDIGGVVLKDADYAIFRDIARTIGIQIEQVLNVMERLLPPFQAGETDEKAFWSLFSSITKKELPDIHPLLWRRAYAKLANPRAGMLRLIASLRKEGYFVGALSNTIPPHAEINRKKGRFDAFDVAILSCEVGLRKPDPRIYLLISSRLSCTPMECVYIDDNKEHLRAAMELGMTTVRFTSARELEKALQTLGLL